MENEIQVLVEAAEQLQALKTTLAEQQGSSVRLRSFADAIERVTTQIAKIPASLSAVVEKAETVEKRVQAAANQVEALRDSIPSVVDRIEKSNVGMSIDALTADISASRGDIKAFRESLSQITSVVEQFQSDNQTLFSEIRTGLVHAIEAQERGNSAILVIRSELLARLDGMEGRIVKTETWSEKSIEATANAFEFISTAVKGSSERQSNTMQGLKNQLDSLRGQDLAGILQEIRAISAQVQQQGVALDAVAKKRGFSF